MSDTPGLQLQAIVSERAAVTHFTCRSLLNMAAEHFPAYEIVELVALCLTARAQHSRRWHEFSVILNTKQGDLCRRQQD